MLQNAYFLAKIGADTAENERNSAEILPKIGRAALVRDIESSYAQEFRRPAKKWYRREPPLRTNLGFTPLGRSVPKIGKISNICKFLAGSFSAVSKRNFARKYAFDSISQALHDLHTSAPLQSKNFGKKSV